jgi:neutral ceramidase
LALLFHEKIGLGTVALDTQNMKNNYRILSILLVLACLSACGGSGSGRNPTSTAVVDSAMDSHGAMCVLESPLNTIGDSPVMAVNGTTFTMDHQPDAPGALELPISNPGPQPAGACTGNTSYRFGSGIYDTTGPIGGSPTGHSDLVGHVLPPQVPNGIHTRLYARAFAIESPCNGKRVMFVSDDHGFPSALLRQEIIKAIEEDPVLSKSYGSDNFMLSSTHTHAGTGGFGDGAVLPALPSGTPQTIDDVYALALGSGGGVNYFDSDNFQILVTGIVEAARRAHANLEAHVNPEIIRMSVGELLNANHNRDPLAYRQNSPLERARYLNENGNEIRVNKRFVQLDFVRKNRSAVGVLNWFGVHPTAMGNHNRLISSDTKGYASLGFEKLMGTVYEADSGSADNFVAAFAQTDEGDAVVDLFVFDPDVNGSDAPGAGVPYRNRYGTDDPYEFSDPGFALGSQKAVEAFGTKELAQALRQFGQGDTISGPVDYRAFWVDMSSITIDDPVVRDNIEFSDLPAALYADSPKTTCSSGAGLGFLAGAPNGFGMIAAGNACIASAPEPYLDDARNHYNGLFNGPNYFTVYADNTPTMVPIPSVLIADTVAPVLCLRAMVDPAIACHKEKPVVTEYPSYLAPFQIFRVGNLAILGLPWEITTMAARRLRQTVLDALAPVGVDTVVIAGLSNGYLSYLTTREEYSAQMYEGGSTVYGPWQLAAVQQESRRLALSLANEQPAPQGPDPETFSTGDPAPITTDQPADFGKLLVDAKPDYQQGDTVDVSWQAGYPGNDPKTMSSYLYVERQNAQGRWDIVATDRDPELVFVWHWSQNPILVAQHTVDLSTAQAMWKIPNNTPAGTYRIRHEGVYRLDASQEPEPYTGTTNIFKVVGNPAICP